MKKRLTETVREKATGEALKYSVVLFSSFFSVFSSVAASARTQIEFTFSGGACEGALCLDGTHVKKTSATLLSFKTGDVCSVKTGKKHFHPEAASELTGLKKCNVEVANFEAGVLDMSSPKFKVRKAKELSETDLKDLAKDFFKSSAFNAYFKEEKFYPAGNKGKIPLTLADIKRHGIEGLEAKAGGDLVQFVRLKAFDGENPGGYFARMKEHWSRVSSGFSDPELGPELFTLRTRLFVKSTSTCQVGCPEHKDEIYEFNGKNFRIITRREYTKPDPEGHH